MHIDEKSISHLPQYRIISPVWYKLDNVIVIQTQYESVCTRKFYAPFNVHLDITYKYITSTQNVATETSWIDVNGGDTVDRCGE